LTVCAINVNSLNTSTIHCSNSKTYLKIEGITGLGADILLISDVRVNKSQERIKLLFGLSQHGGYELYLNSSRESRGVAIAIKKTVEYEILNTITDLENENFLILKIKIRGELLTVGAVYGPNKQDVKFFRNLKEICNNQGNPFILGGDMNTILDHSVLGNLDMMEGGRIPNKRNGEEINKWIREGLVVEPYRFYYPESKEVSYIPFRTRRSVNNILLDYEYNQTRLDFFLVSNDIIDQIKKIDYEGRIGRDFDHKPVVMTLGKINAKKTLGIQHTTLALEVSDIEGKIGIYDMLCSHLRENDAELQLCVGQLDALSREKWNRVIKNEGNRELEMINLDIVGILEQLPPTDEILQREFSCNKRTLYEMVIMGMKNRLLNIQILHNKERGMEKLNLLKMVRKAKIENGIESLEFKIAQDNLLTFEDNKLKQRASKFRDFFNMNTEKGTKAFCRLGKSKTVGENLERICKPNGEKFATDIDRTKHIQRFWANIYKKRLDRLIKIEDFLTQDIINRAEVQNKILDEDEKNSLEGRITIDELSNSLKNSNLESACGWDGISYRVINKFWTELGSVMCAMANESFEEGLMPESFRMGVLKLLPKKTDSKKVENWRPITLLSCGYKILSGVIATRMETFLPKIIGRAQKGFLRHKNIQTVSVNIIDGIAKSINRQEELGVLCIDFIKAFDSVEHSCMESALRFYNFGENFINMVMTILRGRKTYIRTDNGYAEGFDVTRGTPQGDRTSPYIFILVVELLLIRLEHARGGGLISPNYLREYEARLGGVNGVCECYADDLTILFKFSLEGIGTAIRIMEDFEQTSGLGLNIDKTSLMITGSDNDRVGQTISGIKVVNEVIVLGLTIDNKLDRLISNWDKAITKTRKLINYWRSFNLSITGRIMVSKTYLLPQSIYFMNILPMGEEIGREINGLIIDYIRGSDRKIAKDRWFAPREKGGYGMINCQTLDTAIKCNWIKRWQIENEYRDFPLLIATGGDPFNVENFSLSLNEGDENPCIKEILRCWGVFLSSFYRYDENWKEIRIIGNTVLGGGYQFGKNEFGIARYTELNTNNREMKIRDIMSGNIIKNFGELGNNWGITRLEYGIIKRRVEHLKRHVQDTAREVENLYPNIQSLLYSIKKGCKKFRDYLDGKKSKFKEIKVERIPSVINLLGNIEEENRNLLELNMGLWGVTMLPPEFKNFLFKFFHGRLYLNAVRTNFDDISPKCTFCEIEKKQSLHDRGLTIIHNEWVREINTLSNETVWHLFLECPITNGKVGSFFVRMFNLIDWEDWYKMGKMELGMEKVKTQLMVLHWIKFYIFSCRNRRKIFTENEINYEFGIFIDRIFSTIRYTRPFLRNLNTLFQ